MSFRVKLLAVMLPVCLLSAGAIVAHSSPSLGCSIASFFISDAWADNCTNWMKQNNGCSERVCVDNKGKQYCQQSCPGKPVTRIRC
jgi:hypothetical protein